jgi:hypothetical protein
MAQIQTSSSTIPFMRLQNSLASTQIAVSLLKMVVSRLRMAILVPKWRLSKQNGDFCPKMADSRPKIVVSGLKMAVLVPQWQFSFRSGGFLYHNCGFLSKNGGFSSQNGGSRPKIAVFVPKWRFSSKNGGFSSQNSGSRPEVADSQSKIADYSPKMADSPISYLRITYRPPWHRLQSTETYKFCILHLASISFSLRLKPKLKQLKQT